MSQQWDRLWLRLRFLFVCSFTRLWTSSWASPTPTPTTTSWGPRRAPGWGSARRRLETMSWWCIRRTGCETLLFPLRVSRSNRKWTLPLFVFHTEMVPALAPRSTPPLRATHCHHQVSQLVWEKLHVQMIRSEVTSSCELNNSVRLKQILLLFCLNSDWFSVGNISTTFQLLPSCDGCLLFNANSHARHLNKFLRLVNLAADFPEEIRTHAVYLMGKWLGLYLIRSVQAYSHLWFCLQLRRRRWRTQTWNISRSRRAASASTESRTSATTPNMVLHLHTCTPAHLSATPEPDEGLNWSDVCFFVFVSAELCKEGEGHTVSLTWVQNFWHVNVHCFSFLSSNKTMWHRSVSLTLSIPSSQNRTRTLTSLSASWHCKQEVLTANS